MRFSSDPPVFHARNHPEYIAHTVAGPMILSLCFLLRAIISLVCLSGIHSAMIAIFLKYPVFIASAVASYALL